jgi:AcrR family transcriptional regulator
MSLDDRKAAYRESLREDILDAARQLFVMDGYGATSMRGIAAKVGCSPGILYHYFDDKQAIMARLVREAFTQMRARLTAIREDRAPVEDRMRRGLRAYIEFGLDHPHHYALLFMKPDDWDDNESIRAAFQEEGTETFACLLEMTTESIQAGILRRELTDADELAQSLWGAIHGTVSVRIGAKGFPFIERSRLSARAVDILMRGILRR